MRRVGSPASVWAIIAERIDLLEAGAKETLLAASVLGERFSADTLTSIVEQPAAEVVTQLDGLGQMETPAGGLYRRRVSDFGLYGNDMAHGQCSWQGKLNIEN